VKQLRLRAQQRVVATVENSVLRTEMENLGPEEEDAPRRVVLDLASPMNTLAEALTLVLWTLTLPE
jgi:hypothetical protein